MLDLQYPCSSVNKYFFLVLLITSLANAQTRTNAQVTFASNGAPENIILSWKGDPTSSQAITWRTDASINKGFVEFTLADASPTFIQNSKSQKAKTEILETKTGIKYYHSVNLTELVSDTIYAYRVGLEDYWSEWFHFRTATKNKNEPFSFIYFGDAQNNILSLWSRAIRSAYTEAPKAKFMVHAGDLVNRADADNEWREWFEAGDWIHAMVPSIPSPGNHEYSNDKLSKFWKPQFTLPENGIKGLEESNYFIDYQGLRIISLNSNERHEDQTKWLEDNLKNNSQKWTAVVYHHPLFSSADGRNNEELRELWKPLFNKYRVDIALQGHDHTYARGRNISKGVNLKDNEGGTMYVVSVSGPKMYRIHDNHWMDRAAEDTQLFQVITVDGDTLKYKAVTVTGDTYDSFMLIKQKNKPNKLINTFPMGTPERKMDEN